MKREIIFFGNYFSDFYSRQDDKTELKIDFVLDLIRNVERVPVRFLKYLEGTNGLYEIKVLTSLKSIRMFCCFDEDKLIILLNCFIKKTDKTPRKEIEQAIKLRAEYFIVKTKRK